MYDIDNNGTISKAELLEIMKAIYKLMNPETTILPEDESTPQKRTDKIFNSIDKNHDGELTLTEFIEGAAQNESLIRMIQGK
ncbi:neurocalcin-delta B-like [Tubulanus polymorphus]|uniref:neurocalcin-delta B-like n=1 Tax=Tubulanus polymorphus TaxID=672921 RepID=UPI003DA4EF10